MHPYYALTHFLCGRVLLNSLLTLRFGVNFVDDICKFVGMYIYFCIRCFVFEGATGIPREENRFVSVARIILHDHYYNQRNKDNTLRHYIILHTHAQMVIYLPYFCIYLFIPLLDCQSGCLDVPFHTLFVSSSYVLTVCLRKRGNCQKRQQPSCGELVLAV